MATLSQWIAGSRPRTLPAAIAPVVVGTAAAAAQDRAHPGLAILALVVALSLQIGVNYANDYSDGIRGTDTERVGPVRLVGQGLAHPVEVKGMAYGWLGFGAVAGLALVALSAAWPLLIIGALAIVAAWRYTGGERPYGYRGLGELAVFVFFGLVATLGTQYTQSGRFSALGVLGAIAVGSLITAILVANNLRDIPTDAATGKTTLAVRLGEARTRQLYLGLIGVAVVLTLVMVPFAPWAVVALIGLLPVVPGVRAVASGATGRSLIPALASTGLAALAWSLLLGWALSR